MSPIPDFPTFRPLAVSDRSLVESATSPFPPYSDFGFTSLWAWNTDEIGRASCRERV